MTDIYALDVGERFRYGEDLVEVCAHNTYELPCKDCAMGFRCVVGSGCPEGVWYKTIHEGYFSYEEPATEEEEEETTSTCGAVDAPKRQTLFDRITESPDALAEHFVYVVHFGGLYFWCSTLIYPAFPFTTKEKAIAATVARLKEVADE